MEKNSLVKCKRLLLKIKIKIKNLFSIPTTWVSLLILILAIASIIISKELYEEAKIFESSLFSSIFAGLVTGFIITVFSSIKTVYISNLQARLSWLEKTHKMILELLKDFRKLRASGKMSDTEFNDASYEAVTFANDVNARVIQSRFDKVKCFEPGSYFIRNYDYDCMKMSTILYDLRNYIISNGENAEMRKDVIREFEQVLSTMRSLKNNMIDDIDCIKIKIASTKKSII